MNLFWASQYRQKANPAFLSEQEKFLEEYAQAIDSYQKAVLALQEAANTLDTGAVKRLLTQANAAKEAVQQCRNRYLCSFASTGMSQLRAAPIDRHLSPTPNSAETSAPQF